MIIDSTALKFILVAAVILAVFVYWIFNFILLYHLTRFGVGVQPKKLAAVFLLGSISLFLISITLFVSLDFVSLSHTIQDLIKKT